MLFGDKPRYFPIDISDETDLNDLDAEQELLPFHPMYSGTKVSNKKTVRSRKKLKNKESERKQEEN
ncbi:MAG TPA: hypothetical protein VHR42_09065 [Clostridia bacterium]|nr:hypothetical protein [Clostridia bacterium]